MDFKQIFNFLAQLQVNNNRPWFNEHKNDYLRALEEFKQFVDELILGLNKIDSSIGLQNATDCIFRIYRDVRFSKNKDPYKTHFGAYIAKGGRKSPLSGYYIHIQPDESLTAGGIWGPTPEILESVRNEIYNNPEEFIKIITADKFKKYFNDLDNDKLKSAPKGYPKDFKYIDLIKYKSYTISHPLTNEFFFEEKLIDRLVDIFSVQYEFNEFLNRPIR